MINREEFLMELKEEKRFRKISRNLIENYFKKQKKKELQEFKLRKIIKKLIKEAATTDVPDAQPHNNTGINVLEDLLKKIIPVLEDDESFMGIITMEDLFTKIISRFGLNSDGSLLVIEVPQQDFQLSELIRILEMENVHLFSVLVSMENFPNIEITLKTDIKDINSVLQTLERYSYTVKAYFENDQYIHQLKDRYESLISYLNV